jgi:hypothetical protein
MKRYATIIASVLICVGASPAMAGTIYDVDIQGIDPATNHTIRVAGSITFNLGSNHIESTDLKFYHESDTPIQMPVLPQVMGDSGSWKWVATATELRFEALSLPSKNPTFVLWDYTSASLSNFIEASFQLSPNSIGSIQANLGLRFLHQPIVPPNDEDKADFIAVTPDSLLIGTAGVPEPPSSPIAIAMIVLAGGYMGLWKRLNSCAA